MPIQPLFPFLGTKSQKKISDPLQEHERRYGLTGWSLYVMRQLCKEAMDQAIRLEKETGEETDGLRLYIAQYELGPD